jgi:hypothetical protein
MRLSMCALQTRILLDVDALKRCIKGRGALFVLTLGATKILVLFAGNLDAGTSLSLRDVVHATGKGLGIFGWTT